MRLRVCVSKRIVGTASGCLSCYGMKACGRGTEYAYAWVGCYLARGHDGATGCVYGTFTAGRYQLVQGYMN